MEFYFQINSLKKSLKCPKAKPSTHCLTKLFPIYQTKNWTIRQLDDQTIVPLTHRIMLKINFKSLKAIKLCAWSEKLLVVASIWILKAIAFKTCLYASGQMKLEWTNSEQTCLSNSNFLIFKSLLFPIYSTNFISPRPLWSKAANASQNSPNSHKSHWSAPTHFIKGVAGDIAHSVALKQMKIKKDILGGNETFTTFGLLSFSCLVY